MNFTGLEKMLKKMEARIAALEAAQKPVEKKKIGRPRKVNPFG